MSIYTKGIVSLLGLIINTCTVYSIYSYTIQMVAEHTRTVHKLSEHCINEGRVRKLLSTKTCTNAFTFQVRVHKLKYVYICNEYITHNYNDAVN